MGKPRTKPDTEAVEADRDYYRRYQAAVKARQKAAKEKAARQIEAAVIPQSVQQCPPEKMERLFARMERVR